jgi:hypothetical protein
MEKGSDSMKKCSKPLQIVAILSMVLGILLSCTQPSGVNQVSSATVAPSSAFSDSFEQNLLIANQGDVLSMRIDNLRQLFLHYYLHHNSNTREENIGYQREILHLLDAMSPQDPSLATWPPPKAI